MHRREMFSAEIWNQIESQWGREIKKGCSRWWELQSRRLSYHQLIEPNPPTSFPSGLFSWSMLGSNLVVWNHKNSMWKIPCSWHAVVRNFHVQIHLQQGPAFRQNLSLPNVTVKSNRRSYRSLSCILVNISIPICFTHLGGCCSSWGSRLVPQDGCCSLGREHHTRGGFCGCAGR